MLVFMPGAITLAVCVRFPLALACQMWGPTVTVSISPQWERVNFSTNDSCLSSDFILTQNVCLPQWLL